MNLQCSYLYELLKNKIVLFNKSCHYNISGDIIYIYITFSDMIQAIFVKLKKFYPRHIFLTIKRKKKEKEI